MKIVSTVFNACRAIYNSAANAINTATLALFALFVSLSGTSSAQVVLPAPIDFEDYMTAYETRIGLAIGTAFGLVLATIAIRVFLRYIRGAK